MLRIFFSIGAFSAAMIGPVWAESFEDMCLRVSAEWGSTGDVASQCSCLAGMAAADQGLADEITALAAVHKSDAEAYAAASDAGKAAFDQCAVET